MKRSISAVLGLVLVVAPVLASAKSVYDLAPTPGVTVQRQGRRAVREAGHRPIWRNPEQLRFSDTTQLGSLYQNAEFNLSIRYPSDWERTDVNERDEKLTLPVMFLSPRTSSPLRQNINLVIEKLESTMSLAEYTELGIKNEKTFFSDYTLISSTPVPIGGSNRGQRVVFTASTDSGIKMKFAQVWMVRGTRAYVWTFADDQATFEKNMPLFERMLESFILR
jgi:hypothetical protein